MTDENDQDPTVVVMAGLVIDLQMVFLSDEQVQALEGPGGLFETGFEGFVMDDEAIRRMLRALETQPRFSEGGLELTFDANPQSWSVIEPVRFGTRSQPRVTGFSSYGPPHFRRWPRLRSNRPHLRNR